MTINYLAARATAGIAAAAAAAMLTVAPAHAEGDIYTGACGSKATKDAYVGEGPTEQDATNQARASAAASGDECDLTFGATKNECIAVTVTDSGVFTSAVRSGWLLAEEAATTQLRTKFPDQGVLTAVAHCSGGGMTAFDPAAAPAPAKPAPAPKPEPDPDPAGPCVPDPFNLNFPGAC